MNSKYILCFVLIMCMPLMGMEEDTKHQTGLRLRTNSALKTKSSEYKTTETELIARDRGAILASAFNELSVKGAKIETTHILHRMPFPVQQHIASFFSIARLLNNHKNLLHYLLSSDVERFRSKRLVGKAEEILKKQFDIHRSLMRTATPPCLVGYYLTYFDGKTHKADHIFSIDGVPASSKSQDGIRDIVSIDSAGNIKHECDIPHLSELTRILKSKHIELVCFIKSKFKELVQHFEAKNDDDPQLIPNPIVLNTDRQKALESLPDHFQRNLKSHFPLLFDSEEALIKYKKNQNLIAKKRCGRNCMITLSAATLGAILLIIFLWCHVKCVPANSQELIVFLRNMRYQA